MKSRDTNCFRSQTQDSIGVCSRAESYQSSMLIKELDSRCFSIIQQPKATTLSLIGKQLNYAILTENTEEEWVQKVKRLELDNKRIKQKVFQLQDMLKEQRDSYESKIRLKDIAEAEYISGINSMYQRNTHLSQELIIYERQLKSALYKVCQLERELEESSAKSKARINKQMELELKIKQIQEKYHDKIVLLQKRYECEEMDKTNQSREWRFQIENLKQELEKQKIIRRNLEMANQTMGKIMNQKDNRILKLNTIEVENKSLIEQIKNLKEEIIRIVKQKQIQKEKDVQRQKERERQREIERQRERERQTQRQRQKETRRNEVKMNESKILSNQNRNTLLEHRYSSQQNLVSSTIAALAMQNISLKQQQAQSTKTLFLLSDQVKNYQTELYSRSINKQNQYIQKHDHNHNRQSYRKQRYVSVGKQNSSIILNQTGLEFMNTNSVLMKPKYRQSHFINQRRDQKIKDITTDSFNRTRERERDRRSKQNLNDILIRKCKDLNQSLCLQ